MDIISAANILVTLMSTVTNMVSQASQISALIQKAQSEGRTNFTPEEWAIIDGADDAARKVLVDAIAKALAK